MPEPGDPSRPAAAAEAAPTAPDVPVAPPVTRADGGMWLLFAAIGFLAGQIAGVLLISLGAAVAGQSNQLSRLAKLKAPPEWYVAAGLVGLWVGFALAAWLASRYRGTGHFAADLRLRFRPVDALGVLIGLAAQGLVTVMYAPFVSHKDLQGPTTKLTGASHGSGGILLITVLVVVGAAFFEELYFRGVILRGLLAVTRLRHPTRWAHALVVAAVVVVDGLVFGLAHGEMVQLAGLAFFGAVLALLAWWTGRLGMGMVAHGTFNLVAVISFLSTRGVVH